MKEQKIIQFNASSDTTHWKTTTDNVMGGKSAASVAVDGEILQFSGKVSLENNGGFAMARSKFEPIETTGFNGFRVKIKGDGKRYQFRVKQDANQRHSHIQHFETTEDSQTLFIPFDSLEPWFRGNRLDMDVFKGPQVSSVAFLIANKTEESFHLQIESISLVNQ